jgi:hypothetical protein
VLNIPTARVYGAAGAPLQATSIAGRLRVVARRFQDDAGWFSWRGVSCLAAISYVLSGREAEIWARFDDYARARRTVVRVLGMLGSKPWVDAGLAFSPRTPGYADARARVVAQANRRGIRVEFCLFADAQIVVPDRTERRAWLEEFGRFCQVQPGVVPQLANEAAFNGWSEADDPELLELADHFASIVGHRDFSISDPVDGDNPDASAETSARIAATARHCNIVVLHPDRTYGTDDRWRRWIDHLEGMFDVVIPLGPNVAYVVDEPIGAAPAGIPGRRDNDPDAFIAAQFVSLLLRVRVHLPPNRQRDRLGAAAGLLRDRGAAHADPGVARLAIPERLLAGRADGWHHLARPRREDAASRQRQPCLVGRLRRGGLGLGQVARWLDAEGRIRRRARARVVGGAVTR